MKEFELTFRLRNNLLKQKRLEHGFKTLYEAAEAIGVNKVNYSRFEALRDSAKSSKTGSWKPTAIKIAQYYGCTPEELWPNVVLSITQPELVKQIGAEEVAVLAGMRALAELPPKPDELLMEVRDTEKLRACLEELGKTRSGRRKRKVLELRFGITGIEPRTFAEIGEELGRSVERVRQIYLDAVKELRVMLSRWYMIKYEWMCNCEVVRPGYVLYCDICQRESPWREKYTGDQDILEFT
jgi:RNA polymerase sigma factor (sigma-70 family)